MNIRSPNEIEYREALFDTGSDISLFDQHVAEDLLLDLGPAPTVNISGVGGLRRDARLAEVTLELLGRPELAVTMEIAFAPDVEASHGNLIGLDVLEHFDFGLSHRERLGYLGRPAR